MIAAAFLALFVRGGMLLWIDFALVFLSGFLSFLHFFEVYFSKSCFFCTFFFRVVLFTRQSEKIPIHLVLFSLWPSQTLFLFISLKITCIYLLLKVMIGFHSCICIQIYYHVNCLVPFSPFLLALFFLIFFCFCLFKNYLFIFNFMSIGVLLACVCGPYARMQ